jgi:putative transposase
LLVAPAGRRIPRAHDGAIMTSRSNERWCSDALEFTCWNGEIVRIAFALDSHDLEVVSWGATTAGISGEMIRDMMVHCVEQRFGDLRAPRKVQWLSGNGSIFAAYRTLGIAAALNLESCFTPAESPKSNGIAEVFVKTFKRDDVQINPLPDARTALSRIDYWMEDYNSEHAHSRLGYRSPREYIASLQHAVCPV